MEKNVVYTEGMPVPQAPPSYDNTQQMYPQVAMGQPQMQPQVPMGQQQMYPPVSMGQQQMYPPVPMGQPQMMATAPINTEAASPALYGHNLAMGPYQNTLAAPQPLILGGHPCVATCPSCGLRSQTRVDFRPSTKTHLLAMLICVLGGICCCCIPYCMESCKTANHTCSNCGTFLGTYSN